MRTYNAELFYRDLLAGIIVTIMLIPQSLAYAMLAGLPAEMGLYASIVPLVAYSFFGSSKTLSVGPVAVISLMTAATVGEIAERGTADYASAAVALALISGAMLLIMGMMRFGFLTNFLSLPVVSGFITAAGVLIALSQLGHILGVNLRGSNLIDIFSNMDVSSDVHPTTMLIGALSLLWLLWARTGASPMLVRLGFSAGKAAMTAKAAPLLAVLVCALLSYSLDFQSLSVALVRDIPRGLPAFSLPNLSLELLSALWLPALLISLIGFVESVSVGRTLASKKHQKIDPNRELLGLGAANIGSAVSGGFPVTGGIARSMVNYEAGAETQIAGVLAALGIALASLFLTPALYYLPKATLAATIIVAVGALLDFRVLGRAWRYARSDFMAIAGTIGVTLIVGVELGVFTGIFLSVGLHLYKTSKPHVAIVGAVPGTEHYRNIERHDVITFPNLVSIRIDESLYFVNAGNLDTIIDGALEGTDGVEHVVLQCSAVNEIDFSALEVLERTNHRLSINGVQLHLSEVKGPVMDGLLRTDFPDNLSGEIFLRHHDAVRRLMPIETYIP